jgi:hypothetical protein
MGRKQGRGMSVAMRLDVETFGKLLARAIIYRTEEAHREVLDLEAMGLYSEADERRHNWRMEILNLCESSLAHAQAVSDSYKNLATDAINRTIRPTLISLVEPPA